MKAVIIVIAMLIAIWFLWPYRQSFESPCEYKHRYNRYICKVETGGWRGGR